MHVPATRMVADFIELSAGGSCDGGSELSAGGTCLVGVPSSAIAVIGGEASVCLKSSAD